ncbi:hypothetical protein [Paraburkholderia acidisoli]|uniref:Uncharacterized protein n=1 Tax=Paraburkholderia acidisoli TaxID=2571748 RepID=A0A7Z2GRD4_9BURK|nr:hypothetical protein [Paraburkholderia acidisoli]QGZ66286.1 hypothetical protein FAZ98_31305 [Paraburkholderia acidisoli]QGZ66370.1 hypothetical protein FAZ98_31785 [Paraburkholderia acidisoli]
MAFLTKDLGDYAFQRAMDVAYNASINGADEKHVISRALAVMKAAVEISEMLEIRRGSIADRAIGSVQDKLVIG